MNAPSPTSAPPRATPPLATAVLFVTGYVAADWLSYLHPMQQYGITPWNPQPAFAVALLMFRGPRWLPVVFFAALAAEGLVRGGFGAIASSLLASAALTAGYAGIAHALRTRYAVNPALESGRDILRLVAVVAAGAFLTGVLYVAALLATGKVPFDRPMGALLSFWIGDTVGILVTLPFLFVLAVRKRRAQIAPLVKSWEVLLHGAFTATALAVVFASPADEQVKRFYLLFLPLILVSGRHGLAGAILATLVIQAAVVIAGELGGYPVLTIFELQSLLISLTVTGLFLGVTVDERRRAEEDLRRTVRLAAAGEMAAALAHELNQPLTAVGNYARASSLLAQRGAAEAPRLQETLEKLAQESTRAANVVRRLRDFFRTGATQLEHASVVDVAGRVVASLEGKARAHGIEIRVAAPTGLPEVPLDPAQMEVVIRNLVSNAVEAAGAAPAPRHVSVEISRDHAMLRLEVRDSGAGVPLEDTVRIFEPFETTRPTGMGMGLAISRAIVETHGGELWAEPGPGGRFILTLPLTTDDRD